MLKKIILWSTGALSILMLAATLAGLFWEKAYAQEAPGWVIQAIGQDLGTLIVVIPAMLLTGFRAAKGSLRSYLIWIGLVLYVIYAYVIYAFFVHFNQLFLLYVAILGLSFYSLALSLAHTRMDEVSASFSEKTPIRLVSHFLTGFAILFSFLWLSEIIPALLSGGTPKSIIEAGLITNPVYVLDLAFFFPSIALTGYLLKRRRPFGYFFAAPILAFSVAMALPSIGAVLAMAAKGMEVAYPPIIVMGGVAAMSIAVAVPFLRQADRPGKSWML